MQSRVTILAGGVGGARMAMGFDAIPEVDLSVIVNVADDQEMYGVYVAADLDTVIYTLADQVGPAGWGRAGDGRRVIDELAALGVDTRFRLGDTDLGVCLYRTAQMRQGVALHEITARIARRFGVSATILPASNDPIRTLITTLDDQLLDFQTYFVLRRHQDRVARIDYQGIEQAAPAPGVIEAIERADLVVYAPSNPFLSLHPIIRIPGVRQSLARARRVVAVSPLVDGRAVKGPLTDLLTDLGHTPDHRSIVSLLDHVTHLVADDEARIEGISTLVTDTRIADRDRAIGLAREILQWVS